MVAFVCALAAPFLAYQGVLAYMASPDPLGSAGYAVLGVVGLFGLWWLVGKAKVTGLSLARRTVGKLEEEAGERSRILGIAWILFAAAVALVLVVLVVGR